MPLSAADQLVRDRFASLNLPQAYWDLVPLYNSKEGSAEGDWYDYWVPMVNQQYLLDTQQAQLDAAQQILDASQQALNSAFVTFTGQLPPDNPTAMDAYFVYDAGGTGNAYTITRSPVQTAALADKQTFLIRWPHANTGEVTLQVDGLGAVAVEHGGSALTGGELGDHPTWIVYDGTAFQLASYGSEITQDITIEIKASPGAGEFGSLGDVMAYLRTKRFPFAKVTIQYEDAAFPAQGEVLLNHPDGINITLTALGTGYIDLQLTLSQGCKFGAIQQINLSGTSGYSLDMLEGSYLDIMAAVKAYRHVRLTASTARYLQVEIETSRDFWLYEGSQIGTLYLTLASGYMRCEHSDIKDGNLTTSGGGAYGARVFGSSQIHLDVNMDNHTTACIQMQEGSQWICASPIFSNSGRAVTCTDGAVFKSLIAPQINNISTPYTIITNTWQPDGTAIFIG